MNVGYPIGALRKSKFKFLIPLICYIMFSIAAVESADASITTYLLSNHPSGSAAPTYGLRLDNLQDNDQDFTFSIDHSDAEIFLTYDDVANTINIAGMAFGGLDTGSGYDADNSGLFEIDFTYQLGVTEVANGLIVTPDRVPRRELGRLTNSI